LKPLRSSSGLIRVSRLKGAYFKGPSYIVIGGIAVAGYYFTRLVVPNGVGECRARRRILAI
jgi:hypothetical protein